MNLCLDNLACIGVAAPDAEGRTLLSQAARGYHRVLRVARTLADLDESNNVRCLHFVEALTYRRLSPGRI